MERAMPRIAGRRQKAPRHQSEADTWERPVGELRPTALATQDSPQAGWSLVETLAAVTIVLTLSTTVGVVALGFVERGREAAARSQMALYTLALESYYADTGRYPTTEQGLDALWKAPVLAPLPQGWDGPYIQRAVGENPWRNPYRYRSPGANGLPYVIETDTADGRIRSDE